MLRGDNSRVIGLGVVTEPLLETDAERAVSTEYTARLEQLVKRQFGFVWRLLRRIGVAERDADDAAQQVFIVASGRMADIRVGSERAYLFSTAMTLARVSDAAAVVSVKTSESSSRKRSDPIPSLQELVDRHRERALLDQLLAAMPLELRVVFVLYETTVLRCHGQLL